MFDQVKRIHEYVARNTNYTKKQVRQVLSDLQPKLNKSSILAKKTAGHPGSVVAPAQDTRPWNYGILGNRGSSTNHFRLETSEDEEVLASQKFDEYSYVKYRSGQGHTKNVYLDF